MQPYQVRRAAIILLGIILIVFVIVQGVRLIGNIGGQDETEAPLSVERTLPEYADVDNSRVRLTYSGPIVAREEYHQIRMTMEDDQRELAIIRGYGTNVIRRQRLNNSQAAYRTFLRALHLNNFSNAQDNELGDDSSGVCVRGDRIVGQVFEGRNQIQNLWAASCDRDLGTMDARWRTVLRIFQDQFPDYRDFVRDFRF